MVDYSPVSGEPYLYRHNDGTYIFSKSLSSARFVPIIRRPGETFTDLCDREIGSADFVGNGPIYSGPSGGRTGTLGIVDPADINTNGSVFISGTRVDGRVSPSGFYINYNGSYHFGEGEPPSPSNAFSGLGPLIIQSYRPSANFRRPVIFNSINIYDSAVETAPAPRSTGEPHSVHEDNLETRSSATVASYAAGQGIMAIGTSSSTGLFYVVFRDDGVSGENETLSAIEHFRHLRCENAVFLDGSTSITARTKSKYYAEPAYYKNNAIEVGFAVK